LFAVCAITGILQTMIATIIVVKRRCFLIRFFMMSKGL